MAIETKEVIKLRPKNRLTLEEFQKIKDIFIQTFDQYFDSFVEKGDIDEISIYFGKMQSSFRLFALTVPNTVLTINNEIFRSELIRDFHIELLERFSMEIACISENIFEKLIYNLADAAISCKALPSTRDDGIEPILTSIFVKHEDIVRMYLENPWFVTLTLLNTQFSRSKVGSKIVQ